jgi:hypothetical protein
MDGISNVIVYETFDDCVVDHGLCPWRILWRSERLFHEFSFQMALSLGLWPH